MSIADAARVWEQALLLPGESDLRRSLYREAAEFLGAPQTALEARIAKLDPRLAAEWQSRPSTDAFYGREDYILHLLAWHAAHGRVASLVGLATFARGAGLRDVLDFGAGIGTNGLLFAHHGLRVTMADISAPMLAFARWRFERRGWPSDIIDLQSRRLPRGGFDLALAFDVMEHIPAPRPPLLDVRAALRDGGYFYIEMGDLSPDDPSHVTAPETVLRQLRALGYARQGHGRLTVYQKVDPSPLYVARVAVVDGARYGARRLLKRWPPALRLYRALRGAVTSR